MKDLTKEEKKIAVLALKAYHEWTKYQFTTVDQFIEEHNLEEFKFEIGKWYKGREEFLMLCLSENGKSDCGFNVLGEWIEGVHWAKAPNEEWAEATHDEVFVALRNEAVKRGFVEGAIFTPIGRIHGYPSFSGHITCVAKDGSVELMNNQWTIFSDEKWAEIQAPIESTISLSDAISTSGPGISAHDRINILENELAELKKLLHENTKD